MQFMQPTVLTYLSPARDIASSTAKDKILALVYTCVQNCTLPFPMSEELAPITIRKMN